MRTLILAILLLTTPALAVQRPLPQTYSYETSEHGGIELEQWADVTPVVTEAADLSRSWTARFLLNTAVDYGITDHLELGLYFAAVSEPGEPSVAFEGLKQRLTYRLLEEGEAPIDVAIFGQLGELRDALEVELKLIVQRRFGHARLMLNVSGQRLFDYHGGGVWVANPSGGVTFAISHAVSVGLEYWMQGVQGEPTVQFLGPTFALEWKRLWVSVAPYLRLDNLGAPLRSNDRYGRVWVRALVGLEL